MTLLRVLSSCLGLSLVPDDLCQARSPQQPGVSLCPAQYPGTEVPARHALHFAWSSPSSLQMSLHSPKSSCAWAWTAFLYAGVSLSISWAFFKASFSRFLFFLRVS